MSGQEPVFSGADGVKGYCRTMSDNGFSRLSLSHYHHYHDQHTNQLFDLALDYPVCNIVYSDNYKIYIDVKSALSPIILYDDIPIYQKGYSGSVPA